MQLQNMQLQKTTLSAVLSAALSAALSMGLVAVLAASLLLAGCAYKVEIRQGNDRLIGDFKLLRLGMTRGEVERLLGPSTTPRLFRKNELLYVYQVRPSGFVTGTQRRSVQLLFDDDGKLGAINLLEDDFAGRTEGDG